MQITVESSTKLSNEQAEAVTQKLAKLFPDVELDVSFKTDHTLLGGLRVVTPNRTIDMSLAARLNQLRIALQG